MKTPDEIKKGLADPVPVHFHSGNPEPHLTPLAYKALEASHADALAYIQQLEAQVLKWICVEERLPENFATVIIWRSDCKNACIGWLIDGRWSVPNGVRVTHWMPLPEPPKEEDK